MSDALKGTLRRAELRLEQEVRVRDFYRHALGSPFVFHFSQHGLSAPWSGMNIPTVVTEFCTYSLHIAWIVLSLCFSPTMGKLNDPAGFQVTVTKYLVHKMRHPYMLTPVLIARLAVRGRC
jgi:hypothetical protein